LTIDSDTYLQRLLTAFSLPLVIPILSSQRGGNRFVAETAIALENSPLLRLYLETESHQGVVSLFTDLIGLLKILPRLGFVHAIRALVLSYCIRKISERVEPASFSAIFQSFRLLFQQQDADQGSSARASAAPVPRCLPEDELILFVLQALEKRQIAASPESLQLSFPQHPPFFLFCTIALQCASARTSSAAPRGWPSCPASRRSSTSAKCGDGRRGIARAAGFATPSINRAG
jgi:hypothetical protein